MSIVTFFAFAIANTGACSINDGSNLSTPLINFSDSVSGIILSTILTNSLTNQQRTNVVITLNIMCTTAITCAGFFVKYGMLSSIICIKLLNGYNRITKIIQPVILNNRWARAARLAFLDEESDDKSAVTVVPIFEPIIIEMVAIREILCAPLASGVAYICCAIAIKADDDWTTAVSTTPARMPKAGLSSVFTISVNDGLFTISFNPKSIVSRPKKSNPNPRIVRPI